MKIAVALGMLALASPLAGEEVFLYVDPVHGSDTVGGGTTAAPFQTIGFALTQAWHSDHTITLLPGVYSTASGESFPIQVPASINVVGAEPCGAKIVHPSSSPAAPVFELLHEAGGGLFNEFGGLEVETGHAFVEPFVGAGYSSIQITGCEIEARTVLDASFIAEANIQLIVTDCRFRTSEEALAVHDLDAGSILGKQLDLYLSGSRLEGSADSALLDVSIAGVLSQASLSVSRCVLSGAGTGLHATAVARAKITSEITHCLFHGLGTGLPKTGPIVDDLIGTGENPKHAIRRTIFWNNTLAHDLPSYDAASYTLETNLFEDPALVGIGGSITGDPRFAQASEGDWHLTAASPAIDAGGAPSTYAVDWEGDPLSVAQGGDGQADLGPDEHFARYVYFHPRPAVGETTSVRVFGGAGDLWAAYLGPISYWPGFGSGIQLQSLYFPEPLALGLIPSGELGGASIAVPPLPALAGFPYMCQAAYLTTPALQLEFSENAVRGWLCD